MTVTAAAKSNTIPDRERSLGITALPLALGLTGVHASRKQDHALYLGDRRVLMLKYIAALYAIDGKTQAVELRRRIVELDAVWKQPPPKVKDIVDAMMEPGCPRVYSMTTPQWQEDATREGWAGICKFVQGSGAVRNIIPAGTKNGASVFRIEGEKGNTELGFSLTDTGYIAGLYAVSLPTWRPQVPATSLDAKLQQVVKDYHLPGGAALVLSDGEVVDEAATGVRANGFSSAVTVDDRWHLGSDTKAMTSVVAAKLVEQGKLKWDSTVAEIFPDWKIDPSLQHVTLRMLLNHQGHVPANAAWPEVKPLIGDDPVKEREAIVRMSLGKPAEAKTVYSNLGYMIAGTMLQRVSGKPWETLMRDELFTPLEMGTCGFGGPAQSVMPVDQPLGHVDRDGAISPQPPGPKSDNRPSMGPAGTVHCSLRDWAKFTSIYHENSRQTLLSKDSIAELQTPQLGANYSFGWGSGGGPMPGETVLSHTGSNTIYYATAYVSPKQNKTFLFATNYAGGKTGEAAGEVINYMVDEHDR